jgi:hypothetical protein
MLKLGENLLKLVRDTANTFLSYLRLLSRLEDAGWNKH